MESLFSRSIAEGDGSNLNIPGIFKNLREGMLIVGENLRVAYANDAARLIFGKPDEPLVGKRLSEVVRNMSVHEAFLNALTKDSSSQFVYDARRENHSTFDVNVAPRGFEGSKYAVGVFYDITKIEHLERVRQEFLSNISHELRTPLTSILAFIETLENGGVDDDLNKLRFLGIIRRNAERMQHLIHDISELSSIEAGKVRINLAEIPLFDLTKGVLASLSAKAGEREIMLENRVKPETRVMADRFRLEQMLTNLVDNAIKFNRDNGIVTVGCDRHGDMLAIEVTDSGEGIPTAQLSRVFERLYRGDRARSRDIGGTGLGLAIVKHLARLHDGEVHVNSVLGSGSTFIIKLPHKNL